MLCTSMHCIYIHEKTIVYFYKNYFLFEPWLQRLLIFFNIRDSQIVGLTNNSYFAGAHEVRHCVLKYHSLGEYVLEVAKVR